MADRVDAVTARPSPEPPGPSVTRPTEPPTGPPTDPVAVVRTRGHLVLPLVAAALGVPVAAPGPFPAPERTSP